MTALTSPAEYRGLSEHRERLDEIERVLKFDPRHPDRRQLINEYLNLTEPHHVTDRA